MVNFLEEFDKVLEITKDHAGSLKNMETTEICAVERQSLNCKFVKIMQWTSNWNTIPSEYVDPFFKIVPFWTVGHLYILQLDCKNYMHMQQ